MAYPTNIEWTDATWNPIGGCSIASPGCGPCYAQELAGTRLKHHPLYAGTTDIVKGRPIFNGTMTAAPDDDDVWTWPLSWRGVPEGKRRVLGAGMPSTIFVADMSDVFHENRPFSMQQRTVSTIVSSRHIGQFLTKRPQVMVTGIERFMRFCDQCWLDYARARLWFGISAERQKEFDERWPHLRRVAEMGFVVFISYEPAMGPLKLPPDFLALGNRAQVIAGGCSGDRAWPAHPDWFRAVRDQCAAYGVAFFFKQWGEYAPCRAPVLEWSKPDGLKDVEITVLSNAGTPPLGTDTDKQMRRAILGRDAQPMARLGKKAAGALLDGIEHRAFPKVESRIGAAA